MPLADDARSYASSASESARRSPSSESNRRVRFQETQQALFSIGDRARGPLLASTWSPRALESELRSIWSPRPLTPELGTSGQRNSSIHSTRKQDSPRSTPSLGTASTAAQPSVFERLYQGSSSVRTQKALQQNEEESPKTPSKPWQVQDAQGDSRPQVKTPRKQSKERSVQPIQAVETAEKDVETPPRHSQERSTPRSLQAMDPRAQCRQQMTRQRRFETPPKLSVMDLRAECRQKMRRQRRSETPPKLSKERPLRHSQAKQQKIAETPRKPSKVQSTSHHLEEETPELVPLRALEPGCNSSLSEKALVAMGRRRASSLEAPGRSYYDGELRPMTERVIAADHLHSAEKAAETCRPQQRETVPRRSRRSRGSRSLRRTSSGPLPPWKASRCGTGMALSQIIESGAEVSNSDEESVSSTMTSFSTDEGPPGLYLGEMKFNMHSLQREDTFSQQAAESGRYLMLSLVRERQDLQEVAQLEAQAAYLTKKAATLSQRLRAQAQQEQEAPVPPEKNSDSEVTLAAWPFPGPATAAPSTQADPDAGFQNSSLHCSRSPRHAGWRAMRDGAQGYTVSPTTVSLSTNLVGAATIHKSM